MSINVKSLYLGQRGERCFIWRIPKQTSGSLFKESAIKGYDWTQSSSWVIKVWWDELRYFLMKRLEDIDVVDRGERFLRRLDGHVLVVGVSTNWRCTQFWTTCVWCNTVQRTTSEHFVVGCVAMELKLYSYSSVVENDNCLAENKPNVRLVHRRRLLHVRCCENALNNVIRFMEFSALSIRYTKVACESGTVRFKHTLNIKRLLFVIFVKWVQLLVVCKENHGAIRFSVVWKFQSSRRKHICFFCWTTRMFIDSRQTRGYRR